MRRLLRRMAGVGLLLTAMVHGALVAFPYPHALDRDAGESYLLVDRNGEPLREAVGATGERAVWMDLDQMSPWVVSGTIAIEDRRFRSHSGVDVRGVARATVSNLRAGEVVSGASTLTMQLARLLGSQPRSAWGKVQQAVDAVRLERMAEKNTILEQYLNRAPYGAGAVGVEAASRRTFGKSSQHLSLAEAALIAGLPQAPSAHHPTVSPESAVHRQRQVLDAMRETGVVDALQYQRAWSEPLVYRDGSTRPEAMHFTDVVLRREPPPGTIHTTLDRALQRRAQALVREHVRGLAHGGLTQAAVVVLDNENCDVLAMVGSTDWWQGENGRVNGAMSPRQPGSALKPFAYATAWEGAYGPASVVADIPTRYVGGDGALMRPRNYSETFTGPVLMGEALARSLNVPAVRTANAAGLTQILGKMRAAGLSSLTQGADHYGLGLVLGNGEVTPLEVAASYAMFARGGRSCTPRFTQTDAVDFGQPVFTERTAFLVRDVLTDESLRARAFGLNNPLMLGFPVAVKTGTSTNYRDSWTAGFTDDFTVVVWAGDFEGAPMQQLSGAVGAGPLFREVMRDVALGDLVGSVPDRPKVPEDVVSVEVCALSGHAPGDHCPTRRVHVAREHADRPTCAWHGLTRVDRRNGLRASDKCPDEFAVERVFTDLPATYATWQQGRGTSAPTRWSPLCRPDAVSADAVVVVSPRIGDVFLVEPGYDRDLQTLELSVEVDPPVSEVRWLVDGQEVQRTGWPYTGAWALEAGAHEVVALAGGRRSEPVTFVVR